MVQTSSCQHSDLLLSERFCCNLALSSLAVFISSPFRDYELTCQDGREVDCKEADNLQTQNLFGKLLCPCCRVENVA